MGGPRVHPGAGPPGSALLSKKAPLEPSSCHPAPPWLLATASLCGHVGVHRTWGQLPSGCSVLVLLPVEQVSLEKAGKMALMEQDSQDHS